MTFSCDAARANMLEAEPEELRAGGEGGLAQHLVECAVCRARADRILAAQARLDRGLDFLSDRAVIASRRGGRRVRSRPAVRWLAPAGLAAAAIVAGVLLRPADPRQPPDPLELVAALQPQAPEVDPRPGQHALVMRDETRGITIVWLMNEPVTENEP